MSARILIVEDEQPLARGLQFNFEQEGYEAVLAGSGPEALLEFQREPRPDAVVLDLMLPGQSGYETCRLIREIDPHVPVLVLSARTLPEDKAQAFDCGCDQYVTKPFNLPELISRVRNLLARRTTRAAAQKAEDRVYTFDDVSVDFDRFELTVRGRTYELTTMEQQLLRYFIRNEGRVLSRSRILQDVWRESSEITTRSIDNFVMRLRKYIEPDPAEPRHILSVRGTGYRFLARPADADSGEAEA